MAKLTKSLQSTISVVSASPLASLLTLLHLFETLGYKCNFYLSVQVGICLIPHVNLKNASILYAISKWRLFILHVFYEAQTESHLCLLSGSCRTNGLFKPQLHVQRPDI